MPFQMRTQLSQLSPLFLAGLAVLALGAGGDLVYHALVQGSAMFHSAPQLARQQALESVLGHEAIRAHMVTLLGMLVTLAGVLQRGLPSRGRRP